MGVSIDSGSQNKLQYTKKAPNFWKPRRSSDLSLVPSQPSRDRARSLAQACFYATLQVPEPPRKSILSPMYVYIYIYVRTCIYAWIHGLKRRKRRNADMYICTHMSMITNSLSLIIQIRLCIYIRRPLPGRRPEAPFMYAHRSALRGRCRFCR